MVGTPPSKHDPGSTIATREELEEAVLAGVASGAPRPVADEDGGRLGRRAVAGAELRKSG